MVVQPAKNTFFAGTPAKPLSYDMVYVCPESLPDALATFLSRISCPVAPLA